MSEKYIRVGKRKYSHTSIIDLIELHRNISKDPQEIIKCLVREKLTDARNSGWNGPPFDPRVLASIMGIKCKKSEKMIYSEDAELHPIGADGNLVIIYNPEKPKKRQNFSIAHEIAHTFFPEYHDKYKARHKVGKFDPNNQLEYLCDLGASEIIMPVPEFNFDIKKFGISLDSLQKLSELYEVSLEATAIRMIATNLNPCAMIVFAYSYKPKEIDKIESEKNQLKLWNDSPLEQPPMKLRAQYFFKTKDFSSFIPMHKSVDESSSIHQVSVTRKPFRGDTTINMDNRNLEGYIEAMALPGTHKSNLGSNVLVLLFQR